MTTKSDAKVIRTMRCRFDVDDNDAVTVTADVVYTDGSEEKVDGDPVFELVDTMYDEDCGDEEGDDADEA